MFVNMFASKMGIIKEHIVQNSVCGDKGLSDELLSSVKDFYLSNKISRVFPEMKDLNRMFILDDKRGQYDASK